MTYARDQDPKSSDKLQLLCSPSRFLRTICLLFLSSALFVFLLSIWWRQIGQASNMRDNEVRIDLEIYFKFHFLKKTELRSPQYLLCIHASIHANKLMIF